MISPFLGTHRILDKGHLVSSSLQSLAKHPDSLGISTVNGFYGPGSWAGWFFCTITSWIAIIRGDERVHDTILHVLYTNWAAVDLFRQLSAWNNRGTDGMVEELGGPIAAAFTVTYWGLLTSICQFALCILLLEIMSDSKHTSRSHYFIPRKVIILLLGSAIPSISLVHFQRTLPKMGAPNNGIADYVPALYIGPLDPGAHWISLMGACAIGLWAMVYLILLSLLLIFDRLITTKDNQIQDAELIDQTQSMFGVIGLISLAVSDVTFFFIAQGFRLFQHPLIQIFCGFFITLSILFFISTGAYREGWWRILGCLFLAPGILLFLTFFVFVFTVPFSVYLWIITGCSGCFFRPCAPHKISEWDQAFGLVGLIIMLSDVASLVKRSSRTPQHRREGDEEEHIELMSNQRPTYDISV